MLNNFTNINKSDIYLSPQIVEQKEKNMKYDVGNPDLSLGQV
jgi:hypothetical protein